MKFLNSFDGRELLESELLLVRGGESEGFSGKDWKKEHGDRDCDRRRWRERDCWGRDYEDCDYDRYYRDCGDDY